MSGEFVPLAIVQIKHGKTKRRLIAFIENEGLGNSWLVETMDGFFDYLIPEDVLKDEWEVIEWPMNSSS